MPENKKKKKFLNLPRYPGGKEAFKKFIADNLRYPKAAMEARIEGRVIVGYQIDDNGVVHDVHVVKGLGYGCDEEAIRIVEMLRFGKVKNRGKRVKVGTKTNINFRLPKVNYSYSLVSKEKKEGQKKEEKKAGYGYTIKF